MSGPGAVLIGSEARSGMGHATRMGLLGAALEDRGWRVRHAIPPGARDGAGPGLGRAIAAPPWGLPAPGQGGASFADVLTGWGFADPAALGARLDAWWSILAADLPDLVIADAAPGLLLAARGRFPALAIGNGYFLPPHSLTRYPAHPGLGASTTDQGAMRATLNAALARHGAPPLDHLPQLMSGEAQVVLSDPLLDPYAAERTGPVADPLLPGPAPRPGPPGTEIFAYASPAASPRAARRMAEALALVPGPRRAVLAAPDAATAATLRRSGCALEAAALPPDRIAARAALVVHMGTHGLANAMLLAGVPQVALDCDAEKSLTAVALEAAGIGRRMRLDLLPPAEEVAALIVAARNDAALSARARALAEERQARPNAAPLATLLAACDALV